ncbi:MAG: VOC family protein [Pseudomonadota bacterium]
MRNSGPELDHIGLWCADVEADAQRFTGLTLAATETGGSHAGQGTYNRLIGATNGQYLELIGPDPNQSVEGTIIRQVGHQKALTSCLIAYRTNDLDHLNETVLEAGGLTTGVQSMSRVTDDGSTVSWRLLFMAHPKFPILPFFIDWGDTAHPSTRLNPTVSLIDPVFQSQNPDDLNDFLTRLGVSASVTYSSEDDLLLTVESRGRMFLATQAQTLSMIEEDE